MPRKKGLDLSEETKRRLLETTILGTDEDRRFKNWAKDKNIRDVDPKTGAVYEDANYDLRGYFKEHQGENKGLGPSHVEGEHFPDTYKQKGHESFSNESKYARPGEAGMWVGEKLVKEPKMAVSHRQNISKNVWGDVNLPRETDRTEIEFTPYEYYTGRRIYRPVNITEKGKKIGDTDRFGTYVRDDKRTFKVGENEPKRRLQWLDR